MISNKILYRLCPYRRSLSGSQLENKQCLSKCVQLISYQNVLNKKWFHSSAVRWKAEKTAAKKKEKSDDDNEDNQIKSSLSQKKKSAVPPVQIWKNMTVQELAKSTDRSVDTIIEAMNANFRKYFNKPSSSITHLEIIQDIVKKLGRKSVIKGADKEKEKETDHDLARQPPPNPKDLVPRPPVVTIMGHVDHGKTTLLDSLRNTSVVASEFGGITQHIGAFSVNMGSGKKITFIDTPGHAAFSAMRARGANVTDIVVLVVAADDGVMEQTTESIKMARRAGVHIIVAINKIDKGKVDLDKVHRMLLQEGIQVEDVGGDVQAVPISALKKLNLDKLIEAILTESEMMELKGDPKGLFEGVVIESKIDKLGKLATVIVKRGTLRKGTVIVAGLATARVRSMIDESGGTVREATPSTPVQITGWKDLPSAGDEAFQVSSEKEAANIVKWRKRKEMEEKLEKDQEAIEERAIALRQEYLERKELRKKHRETARVRKGLFLPRKKEMEETYEGSKCNILIKGDVAGSVEAILDILSTYDLDDECKLDVVNFGVGNVTESDVELAELFDAVIYCFNVNVPAQIQETLKEKNIPLRLHNVIYHLIDDLKVEISKNLPLKDVEEILGEADVIQNFFINEKKKKVPVAGCKCSKGELKKDANYRIYREDQIIFEGKLKSMKHHKTEVDTINKDVNCGLMFENFEGEFKSTDKIICYTIIQVPQKTSWNPGF